jgi:hypothetical protein
MLFNLESDDRHQVVGYIVPDAFSTVPVLRIANGETVHLTLPANEIREALVTAGRHETGQCGFRLDGTLLPGLAEMDDLQIFDHETNVLIYRRHRPGMIESKVLRIETHIFPLWRLDDCFQSRFQYHVKGLEAQGRETVTQLFHLNHVESVYLGGRILYKNYAHHIEAGFKAYMILQEPHAELAERLLIASKLRHIGTFHLGMRDQLAFEPVMNFAEQLDFNDEKALRKALRAMPHDVAVALANPTVRQLTASTPDEMPSGGAVAAALDIASSFAVIGLRERPRPMLDALGELFDLAPDSLPNLPNFGAVASLASTLREIGVVEHLLEKDLEFHHAIAHAIRTASPRASGADSAGKEQPGV